jgi:hypothetical protein
MKAAYAFIAHAGYFDMNEKKLGGGWSFRKF